MKKSILSLAVAAGVSTTAMAQMHINHQGTGEALVYPLYNAQNGNDTYISVVNTTGTAKAVKVRVLEAENSQEVIDFNLYMSPEDHFSFAITATAEGAKLVTADTSCTVPAIPAGGVEFVNFQYDEDKGDDFDNTSLSRTQVGHIEVIEMGQIAFDEDEDSVYQATLHGANGMPANCAAHTALWSIVEGTAGAWKAAPLGEAEAGFVTGAGSWLGGGLYGYGQIVNVAEGTAFGYDAIAIDGLVDPSNDGAALHYPPGDIDPNFTNPRLNTSYMAEAQSGDAGASVLAVGALFQSTKLENDYVIDPTINALTDWVITQPTKSFHINTTPVIPPYNVAWNKQNACEPVSMETWDREEAYVPPPTPGSQPPQFSPAPVVEDPETPNTDIPLCFETTIVQFGSSSAIGAADVVIGINDTLDYTEGWAKMAMDEGSIMTDDDDADWNARSIDGLVGLPVTGFAVIKYTNSSANEAGALANYAVSTEHKSHTMVSGN